MRAVVFRAAVREGWMEVGYLVVEPLVELVEETAEGRGAVGRAAVLEAALAAEA